MFTYNWYQWLAFFYFYCFFGWVFESSYVSIKQGKFVNRGFLRIPMLPLYGSGAVMMLWVSLPFRDSLILTYLSGVIGATVLEYVTGYMMELLFKVRYWDYSDKKFNIHGYICLGSSIAWGFLTILMTEAVHRPVAAIVLDLNQPLCLSMVLAVSCLFLYDVNYSVREALAFGKSLETLTKLRNELEGIQVQAALLKMEAFNRLEETKAEFLEHYGERYEELLGYFGEVTGCSLEELRQKAGSKLHLGDMTNLKGLAGLQLENLKGKTEAQLSELRMETENKINSFRSIGIKKGKALLRANPTAASSRFGQALKDLKAYLEEEKL